MPAAPLVRRTVAGLGLSAMACLALGAQSGTTGTAISTPRVTEQPLPSPRALIFAVHAVSERIVWASGTGGTIVRTTNGGDSWEARPVPGGDSLQFRDIHAFGADTAFALSIGPGAASRIYRTTNGGASWDEQFRNADSSAFYDCFTFLDPSRAVVFGDAANGRTHVLRTVNGGATWSLLPPTAVPAPLEGEGAYAASGRCVVHAGERVFIATGGPGSRLFVSEDAGASFTVRPTPFVRSASAGTSGLAFRDPEHGIGVAGDMTNLQGDSAQAVVAVTADGGRSWELRSRPPLPGALTGVTWVPGAGVETAVAAGFGGVEAGVGGCFACSGSRRNRCRSRRSDAHRSSCRSRSSNAHRSSCRTSRRGSLSRFHTPHSAGYTLMSRQTFAHTSFRNAGAPRLLIAATALALLTACGGTGDDTLPDDGAFAVAREAITADGLLRHIAVLAADSLEGRAPATPGEDKTVRYLTEQFQALGLAPGNPDGTYVQQVSLVGITSQFSLDVTRNGTGTRWRSPEDYVVRTRYPEPEVSVENSELVFVGYGVQAPEFDWDDYKGMDMTGKTLVMLVNDPAVPNPSGDGLDPDLFRGEAMTYYGRWTYKYEIASAMGAAAALIVHETGPAGYPYEVISSGGELENLDTNVPGGPVGRVRAEGWMAREAAVRLMAASGLDFDSLKAAAATRDFLPAPLNATATINLRNRVREVESTNVVARLEGSDPALREEWVVFTAHWDHLGRDTSLEGDQIYNGALDNASGTAALLEMAGAFAGLPERTPRSLLFLAVTAEEQGLLGAKWYAERPLYPLAQTVANINIDGVNQWGPTRDITVIGLGNSSLDEELRTIMERDGRTLAADPEPEKGFFFRSDHFEFAKKGVPALYTEAGTEFLDKADGFGQMKRDEYTANDYHKVSDEIKPDWDLAGAVADVRALMEVGWRVAGAGSWPSWSASSEFKATRDSMLANR